MALLWVNNKKKHIFCTELLMVYDQGSTKKILNFTFTCLNDVETCKSAEGNFTIGIWEIENENYDALNHCLSFIIADFESTSQIELDGSIFQIKLYWAGDMKFLLNIYGKNNLDIKKSTFICL